MLILTQVSTNYYAKLSNNLIKKLLTHKNGAMMLVNIASVAH